MWEVLASFLVKLLALLLGQNKPTQNDADDTPTLRARLYAAARRKLRQ